MADRQEQIDQFFAEWLDRVNPAWHGAFKEEFYDLLRSFVEDCKGAVKEAHVKFPITVTQTALDLVEEEIRSAFGWLKEK